MSDPTKLVERLTEQLDHIGAAFGQDFWKRFKEEATFPGRAPAPAEANRRAAGAPGNAPPLDLYVTADEVVVQAVLPGLQGPQFATLSLIGPTEILLEAFVPAQLPEGVYLQRERFAGYCFRILTLPTSVQPTAQMGYEDGILEIRLRRAEPGVGSGVAVLHVK